MNGLDFNESPLIINLYITTQLNQLLSSIEGTLPSATYILLVTNNRQVIHIIKFTRSCFYLTLPLLNPKFLLTFH